MEYLELVNSILTENLSINQLSEKETDALNQLEVELANHGWKRANDKPTSYIFKSESMPKTNLEIYAFKNQLYATAWGFDDDIAKEWDTRNDINIGDISTPMDIMANKAVDSVFYDRQYHGE